MLFYIALAFDFLITFFLVLAALTFKKRKIPGFFPSVTVVIPALNEEENIKECARSVMSQDYKGDFDVVIIGGGTDATPRITRRLSKKYSKLKFIEEKKPKGKYYSLNRCARLLKNDVLVSLDADNVVQRDWLSQLVAPLRGNISISFCMQTPFEQDKILLLVLPQMVYFGMGTLGLSYFASGASMAIKKEVFRKRKFRKFLLEDIEFCLGVRRMGFKTKFVPCTANTHFVKTLKGFFEANSRYFRGIFQLAPLYPEHLLSMFFVLLWPPLFFFSLFFPKAFFLNVFFYFLWTVLVKQLGFKVGIKNCFLALFSMVLLFFFSFFYTLQLLFSRKRWQWTWER